MLFDLRSRRRRTAVRVIYVFLAFIMLAGLVLVGVGTGNNNGGLLNAFTNNGSGGNGNAVANKAVQTALATAKKKPDAPASWSGLMTAYYTAAESGSNYNSTTGAFTKGGKAELKNAVTAWNKYLDVTKQKASLDTSLFAAKIYQSLADWKNAAVAWQYMIGSQKAGSLNTLKGYECVALNSYAAGNSTNGALAGAKALALQPTKLEKTSWKADLKAIKGSKTTAAEYVSSLC
jgi:hypothetical protein